MPGMGWQAETRAGLFVINIDYMRFTLAQVTHTSNSYKLVTKWALINIGACVLVNTCSCYRQP